VSWEVFLVRYLFDSGWEESGQDLAAVDQQLVGRLCYGQWLDDVDRVSQHRVGLVNVSKGAARNYCASNSVESDEEEVEEQKGIAARYSS